MWFKFLKESIKTVKSGSALPRHSSDLLIG